MGDGVLPGCLDGGDDDDDDSFAGAEPPDAAAVGTKAYSHDGVHWTWAGYNTYSYTMNLTDGTAETFYRREEPKLLFDNAGEPLALFNVVDPNFLYNDTRIIVQELDYS
eukprot:gene1715-9904_t